LHAIEAWQVFERTYQGQKKLMLAPHSQLADAKSTAHWRLMPRKQSHGAKPSPKGSFGFWLLCLSQQPVAAHVLWGNPCRNFHSGAFRLGCWDLGPCPNPYSSIVHPCVGAEAPGIKVKDASKEVAKSAWLKLINLIIIDNHRMIPSDDSSSSRRFQLASECRQTRLVPHCFELIIVRMVGELRRIPREAKRPQAVSLATALDLQQE